MATILRRYTDVLSLLDILRNNRLTLVPPDHWYDQNDALGLKKYSERKGDGSVFALCLAEGYEQAHHWQLFAGHSHGVCIQFDKSAFLNHLNAHPSRSDLVFGEMKYMNLKQIKESAPISTELLPFLKRDTFKAEAEYRVVAWEERWLAGETYQIAMPARLISAVTLGPAMHESLAQTLKEIVQSFSGCSEIPFRKSRLVNNAKWEDVIESV